MPISFSCVENRPWNLLLILQENKSLSTETSCQMNVKHSKNHIVHVNILFPQENIIIFDNDNNYNLCYIYEAFLCERH